MTGTPKLPAFVKKVLVYGALVFAALYSVWPITIMAEEGFDIDLSPIFSGRGIAVTAGIPHVSGGIHPTLIHYIDALGVNGFPRLVGNAVAISWLSIAIALVAGVGVAYALARVDLRGTSIISYMLLALRVAAPFWLGLRVYLFSNQDGRWNTIAGGV